MIVPDFWAEARRQHRGAGKQVTVRRYGWSMRDEADAFAMAEARAEAALQRILGGDALPRREPKVAYNGAVGVPIREEVLARHDEEVVTRNSYGAHCLNTPRVLFADIDFARGAGVPAVLVAFAVLATGAIAFGAHASLGRLMLLLVVSAIACMPLANLGRRAIEAARGGPERVARARIGAFLRRNPSWNLRMYRTPSGYRLLATHRLFDAASPEVHAFFTAVAADPLYMRMCVNQRCFRARLTAKPWRIGMHGHMRPRPGIWPVRPEARAIRDAWIGDYEARAAPFAACRYVESAGSGELDPVVAGVVALHDEASKALVAGAKLA